MAELTAAQAAQKDEGKHKQHKQELTAAQAAQKS